MNIFKIFPLSLIKFLIIAAAWALYTIFVMQDLVEHHTSVFYVDGLVATIFGVVIIIDLIVSYKKEYLSK